MQENKMDVFNELIRYVPHLLDKPIEELAPISFIGQAAVTAYRGLVGRLDSLPMTEEQKAKTLADGQQAGKMLLAIEGRIGELLPSAEEAYAASRPSSKEGRPARSERALPDGIDSKQAYNARAIANNPDAVAEVIAEAEENEDIPTKTAGKFAIVTKKQRLQALKILKYDLTPKQLEEAKRAYGEMVNLITYAQTDMQIGDK